MLFGQGAGVTNAVETLSPDPKALLLLAERSNGLTGESAQPWHLKVSYKFLDDQGVANDQGTFEELWSSRTHYKQILTGQKYSRTEYGTEKGIVFTGDKETPRAQILEMEREFASPVPDISQDTNLQFESKPLDLGPMHLVCLQANSYTGGIPNGIWGRSYCINVDKPALRITANSFTHSKSIHNHLISYQGRFLAGDLSILKNGKTVFTAHLENINPLTETELGDLQPPADAQPFAEKSGMIQVAGGVTQGMLLYKVAPDYPAIAKDTRVDGIVVLEATIDKTGHIRDLKVQSGPHMLQQAAIDAVNQWVYRPYLLAGDPVEVKTTVNVIFSLGAHEPGK
jgi:TonB family protein